MSVGLIIPGAEQRADSRPALNLARFHRQFTHGDVTAFLTWYGPDLEECVALVPTFKFGISQDFMPAVFLISEISIYAEGYLGDVREAIWNLRIAAAGLGLDDNPMTIMRLRSIVAEHIDDVLRMPPERPRENEEWRATISATDRNTGETTELRILDDV